jgi:hypothetical protein
MGYARLKNTAPDLSPPAATDAASVTTADHRKEERFEAEGSVCLILDHDGLEAVTGRLANVSNSGFRAVHRSPELRPGRVIRFHYEDRQSGKRTSGWARVVWCREIDSRIETGCYVVIAD